MIVHLNKWLLGLVALALLCLPTAADSKAARERLREIKKAWPKAPKSERLEFLSELRVESENSVDDFLLSVLDSESDFDTAGEAARMLVAHKVAKDAKDLLRSYTKAKEPLRRAACLRWLGRYGAEAPLTQLKDIAITDDGSAPAAAQALAEAGTTEALKHLETVASISKNAEARKWGTAGLLALGDKRGLDPLGKLANIEDASFAAHFAIGGELERDALREVLTFAAKRVNLGVGVRPHLFASFLARLSRPESHKALLEAEKGLDKSVAPEVTWWLLAYSQGEPDLDVALNLMGREEPDDIIAGLRYLQRQPKALDGEKLKRVCDALVPLLTHANDNVVAHALLAAGACRVDIAAVHDVMSAWLDADGATKQACALLAIAAMFVPGNSNIPVGVMAKAIRKSGSENWFVTCAWLELLRVCRTESVIRESVLQTAQKWQSGRVFNEAIGLLVDLTGQDFGDDLKKWEEWIAANKEFKPIEGKLPTLRGYKPTITGNKTRARYFGLEIDSTNVEFAIDRSISMIDPVAREPKRPDFKTRKADVLKRRAEVNRMVRDGFLPRFYVAACEVSAALDGMAQSSKFGFTLFNTESVMMGDARIVNNLDTRKNAVNWLLSTEVKGGTDIKAALCALCEKGDADTILLLSDGEPLSLGIIEQIQRSNAITRVNIEVISLAKIEYSKHYLGVVSKLNAGRYVEAEPRD
ncbi:MAG: HEAT repeat domain-containing protein [Planctomycetes bacterium]|nr:HEAT repeat domain-containing protein [Planctomycetota bacterium]